MKRIICFILFSLLIISRANSQDVIVKCHGEEMQVKIGKIDNDIIYYSVNGTEHKIEKEDVFCIKYGIGTSFYTVQISNYTGPTTFQRITSTATNEVSNVVNTSSNTNTSSSSSYSTTPQSSNSMSTVADHQGNIYKTVKIGNQWWMAENMKATTSKDSVNILKFPANNFMSLDEPMCYYYADSLELAKDYGCLYNFPAAKEICPEGWHLPKYEEWIELQTFLEQNLKGYRDYSVAKVLASKTNWITCEIKKSVGYEKNSNNWSGFNALPAGAYQGYSTGIEFQCNFWTSSLIGQSAVRFMTLFFNSKDFRTYYSPNNAQKGYSVRCVKDRITQSE